MIPRPTLFVPGKLGYVKGHDRPRVDCILCGVARGDRRVKRLEVFRTRHFVVSLNLYPYSPGHLLIFPRRHVTDLRELTPAEGQELFLIEQRCLTLVERVYRPRGFNLGYNHGQSSGASIPHLHLHLIPRYGNEIGVIDLLGGARIIVEEPRVTLRRLKAAYRALGARKKKR